jgi:hypothetical protein
MNKISYEIVEHDGGWANKVDGVFSETFASHNTHGAPRNTLRGSSAFRGIRRTSRAKTRRDVGTRK